MRFFYLCIFSLMIVNCATPKHKAHFLIGKKIDFSNGKWLINKPETNSKVLAYKFKLTAYDEFKKILGNALYEKQDLQADRIFDPEIPYDLNRTKLAKLYKNLKCDFLINIRGTIQSNGIGTLGSSQYSNYTKSTNATLVEIIIYDLKNQEIISNSEMQGIITDGSDDPSSSRNNKLYLVQSNENSIIDGLKKLIRKYDRFKL